MLYFPQLSSGAAAQYPFLKRRAGRTIASVFADGSASKLLDPSWAVVEWQLAFSGLTTEERNGLEAFFQSTEGRLREFTFLDPADNLLVRSEEFTSAAWLRGPMLQITENVPDPNGTCRASRIFNTGAEIQRIQQAISGPSWYHYCFSLYARSDQVTRVSVFRSVAAAEDAVSAVTGPIWGRLVHTGRLQSSEETITFGIGLEAGAAVDVYGMQVECQPGPSPYKRTRMRSGVYRNCRFDEDQLPVTADGPEQHSCSVRLTAVLTDQT